MITFLREAKLTIFSRVWAAPPLDEVQPGVHFVGAIDRDRDVPGPLVPRERNAEALRLLATALPDVAIPEARDRFSPGARLRR